MTSWPNTEIKSHYPNHEPVVWQAHLVVDWAENGFATSHLRGGHGMSPRVGITQHDVAVVTVGVEHPQVQNGDAMHLVQGCGADGTRAGRVTEDQHTSSVLNHVGLYSSAVAKLGRYLCTVPS